MKNLKFFPNFRVGLFLIATFFSSFCSLKCMAQQQNAQWPFYLAIEDASHAKDTLWMVFDTSATYPQDFNQNLGQIPLGSDNGDFRVWIYLDNSGNEYNTNALDFTSIWQERYIHAVNFVYPITVRWDSSLFNSEVLFANSGYPINHAIMDNEYLFLSGGGETGWDMLVADSVELPSFWWGSGNQFPLFLSMSLGPVGSGVGVHKLQQIDFSVFPNPATDYVFLTFPKVVQAYFRIMDANGKLIKSESFSGDRKRINIEDLESGLYFIEIQSEEGRVIKKLVVN